MDNNYQELYKKHRPKKWEDLVGQEGVVKNLREEVIRGEVPTAYLLAGKQHGAGKTSAAWLLAKAVNCENLDMETGNPCNKCSTCKNIDANTQIGVNYVSMANKGSVQAANDIIRQAQMAQPIKRPVWILDEAHRMSKEAAEAWLIPLESPNMKALFIFCSTEPEKILDTVKSRVQQKTFKSIDVVEIFKHLTRVAKEENLNVTEEQIKIAALEGKGSLRDAMQNLEVIARDGKLSASYKNKILSMLSSKNYPEALKVAGEMEKEGQDFVKATEQVYRDFSDMLLILSGAEPSSGVVNKESYREFASSIGVPGILAVIKTLGETLNNMVYNTVDSRILFEVCMVKVIQILRKAVTLNQQAAQNNN